MYVPEYGNRMDPMTIGQLAAEAGVERGDGKVLPASGSACHATKAAGDDRPLPGAALIRLRFIKACQSLGFSLDDVQALLALEDGQSCSQARGIAEHKLTDVRQRIGLAQARACAARPGRTVLGDPANGELPAHRGADGFRRYIGVVAFNRMSDREKCSS